jgi:hypothetical protein
MLSKPINEPNPSAYHGEQENLFDVLFQNVMITRSYRTKFDLPIGLCKSWGTDQLVIQYVMVVHSHQAAIYGNAQLQIYGKCFDEFRVVHDRRTAYLVLVMLVKGAGTGLHSHDVSNYDVEVITTASGFQNDIDIYSTHSETNTGNTVGGNQRYVR